MSLAMVSRRSSVRSVGAFLEKDMAALPWLEAVDLPVQKIRERVDQSLLKPIRMILRESLKREARHRQSCVIYFDLAKIDPMSPATVSIRMAGPTDLAMLPHSDDKLIGPANVKRASIARVEEDVHHIAAQHGQWCDAAGVLVAHHFATGDAWTKFVLKIAGAEPG